MAARPNIILITTHDTGKHFGFCGVPTVDTPALDQLADEGVALDRCFSVSPICSPSRASVVTGRYPQQHKVYSIVGTPNQFDLAAGERPIARRLKDAGYRTAVFGIHHECTDAKRLGFDDAHKIRGADGKPATAPQYARHFADYFTEHARRAGQDKPPLYAQIGFFETHTPYEFGGCEPDDSKGVHVPPFVKDDEAAREHLAKLQGAVRRVDQAIGHITETLRQAGLDRDTLLIFTVDHGVELPRAKWFLYDPGIEIATILRWPDGGIEGGRRVDRLISNVDFLPTVLELIDLTVDDRIAGRSFADEFGRGGAAPREKLFAFQNGYESRAVRTDRHKLIVNFERHLPCTKPGDVSQHRETDWAKASPPVELYDLEADPIEFENLADDPAHADTRAEMLGRLRRWLHDMDDPILHGPACPTPFYEHVAPIVR
jgi:arylsulfatase A-like enzyme